MLQLLIFIFNFFNFASIEDKIKTRNLTLIFENSYLMNIGGVCRVYLETCLEKNFFKLPIKLLTLRLDFSNYVYKKSKSKLEVFLPKKRLFCFLFLNFSPRHNKNQRKALNVEHLARGQLEKYVHLQLLQIAQITHTFSWHSQ